MPLLAEVLLCEDVSLLGVLRDSFFGLISPLSSRGDLSIPFTGGIGS